jgi:hypothetical protein
MVSLIELRRISQAVGAFSQQIESPNGASTSESLVFHHSTSQKILENGGGDKQLAHLPPGPHPLACHIHAVCRID